MPPEAIDPAADDRGKGIPSLPSPDVEGVGNESGPAADKPHGNDGKGAPTASQ